MKKNQRKFTTVALLAVFCLILGGCAATYTGLRYKDLQVQNKMTESIFLDPVAPAKRTVFIQIRNTSDKPFELQSQVAGAIAAKGYRIVQDPNKATYMLQANVRSVGEADESAIEKASVAGFGGVAGGAALGAVLAGSGNRGTGAVVGGAAAAAAELVSGALVKVVTYMVVTDLQISEKAAGGVSEQFSSDLKQGTGKTTVKQTTARSTNWKRYQTRIVSTARQTNLTFQEAYPPLRQGIAQAIAGIM